MKNKRRVRIILLVVILVGIASFGAWRYLRPTLAASNAFTASGTIEATSVRLSPEVSGVVTELNSAEGQEVKAGQVLAKINDATAQTQYAQTKAALESAQENLALAQANYALVSANNTAEQRQSAISAADAGSGQRQASAAGADRQCPVDRRQPAARDCCGGEGAG